MIWLLMLSAGAGMATYAFTRRMAGDTAASREPLDNVSLYLKFVRSSGQRKLAILPEIKLLELGMATCESLREFDGNAELTILAAVSQGASQDFVLPVVVGAGFFLCPEYKEDVKQIGFLGEEWVNR